MNAAAASGFDNDLFGIKRQIALKSINPATGDTVARYREHSPAQVKEILALAHADQQRWRDLPVGERAACLLAMAEALARREPELAGLITLEMGKPLREARAEIQKCAQLCRYYAEASPSLLAPRTPEAGPSDARIRFEPLGIILGVMPWNFPFWQPIRSAVPALVGGNAFLLKHAPSVTGCALALEEIMRESGLPDNLFKTLIITEDRVEDVIRDGRVRAVTLTGSCRAGAAVAQAAARSLKKSVLELGGSDPFIVLADADLDAAVRAAVAGRFKNNGQTCVSAKRFLVDREIVSQFEKMLAGEVAKLSVGDPMLPGTHIGPMAREDLRYHLNRQVALSMSQGARIVLNGGPVPGPGYYFRPVILGDVRPGMPVFDEEVFGPVASVTAFRSLHDALRLANQTRYGLGASVWTRNAGLAATFAGKIDAGNVSINSVMKSDHRLPFGGVKDSGHGREMGAYGLMELVNIKVLRGL